MQVSDRVSQAWRQRLALRECWACKLKQRQHTWNKARSTSSLQLARSCKETKRAITMMMMTVLMLVAMMVMVMLRMRMKTMKVKKKKMMMEVMRTMQ
eukprot:592578-Rhodomonas_salina.1